MRSRSTGCQNKIKLEKERKYSSERKKERKDKTDFIHIHIHITYHTTHYALNRGKIRNKK
jgi:hypothetical protein